MLGLDDRELESVDRERESVDMLKMDVSDRERESVEDVTLDGGGDSDGDVAFFVGLLPCKCTSSSMQNERLQHIEGF